MQHRTDIEGLRAVAILPILLFHAGVSKLAGGFVGVDVFFVISGFLITRIIINNLEAGRFSILDFYHRRIVRILPALIVMVTATLLMGWRTFFPNDMRNLGESAAATMAFASNLFFWGDAGYFAGAAETKPLLHTWSLGVEEQFYIFYPLLIVGLHRLGRAVLVRVLAGMVTASFVISWLMTSSYPDAAFYLLPSRTWELGLGSLVALDQLPRLTARRWRDLASLAGLGLIAAGILFIRSDSAFPAPTALLPCSGAALLIAYGVDSVTAPLLSLSPVRWIGAVSYSLYLWHWPIITFYRLRYGMELEAGATILLLLLSFLAASLSYYLIERPALDRWRRASPARIVRVGAGAIAVMMSTSAVIAANAATLIHYPKPIEHIASYADYRERPEYKIQFGQDHCFVSQGEEFDYANCLKTDPGRRNVLLVGDSHAAQYMRALELRFPSDKILQATASGCRPVNEFEGEAGCTGLVRYIFEDFLVRQTVDEVVLAGRWKKDEADSLIDTVRMLRARGLKVTVIGPTVEYEGDLPRILANAMARNEMPQVVDWRKTAPEELDRGLRSRIEAAGARYLSEVDAECERAQCALFDRSGAPFHFDYGHLTLTASRQVIAHL